MKTLIRFFSIIVVFVMSGSVFAAPSTQTAMVVLNAHQGYNPINFAIEELGLNAQQGEYFEQCISAKPANRLKDEVISLLESVEVPEPIFRQFFIWDASRVLVDNPGDSGFSRRLTLPEGGLLKWKGLLWTYGPESKSPNKTKQFNCTVPVSDQDAIYRLNLNIHSDDLNSEGKYQSLEKITVPFSQNNLNHPEIVCQIARNSPLSRETVFINYQVDGKEQPSLELLSNPNAYPWISGPSKDIYARHSMTIDSIKVTPKDFVGTVVLNCSITSF